MASGYGIRVPRPLLAEFGQTRLFNYDHFLAIEATPQLGERLCESMDQASSYIGKFVRNYIESPDTY